MSIKQNFPTIEPTLNLDFANSKAVDQRITFVRASGATYTNALGIQQTVRDNKPRIDFDPQTGECKGLLIEEQRTNLLSNSSDILANANWSLNGCLTPIRANVVSPSGLMDAYKILENSALARHETNFINFAVTSGTTYVATIYAKAAERNYLALAFGGYPSATFNLATGVATSDGTQVSGFPKITAVGNGWYRCEYAWLCTSSSASMNLYMGIEQQTGGYVASQGTAGYGLYIWGAQVEAGNFTTSYIPTPAIFATRSTSATYFDAAGVLRTAPANTARYGYSYDTTTAKWVSQGLLLEPGSTNILFPSDLYGNTLSAEGIYTVSVNSVDVKAPDGSSLTTKVVSGTSGNSWYWRIPSSGTFSANTTYTTSVWIRCASGTTAQWSLQPYPYAGITTCNITDQWQRFSVTFTTDGSGTQPYIGLVSPTQSRTMYLWGWQAEPGSLTTYIPTYTAAVARGADTANTAATARARDSAALIGSNFTSWWKNTEQTYYAEADQFPASDYGRLIDVSDGVTQRYSMYRQSGTGTNGINSQIQTTGDSWSTNTFARFAASFSSTGISSGFNGTLRTNVSSFTPFTADRMNIGQQSDSNGVWNGHIKKISYYNKRLTDAQLQALTV